MKNTKENKTRYKIRFYFISLWLLFLLVFLVTINIINEDKTFIGFKELFTTNWLSFSALLLSIIGLLLYKKLSYELKGAAHPPYKIEYAENQSYEYLTFLTTYIIPLISFKLSECRYVIIFIILLIVVGIIFVKTDLYYGNPTLALMGYRLYRVTISNHPELNEVILITRDKLYAGDSFLWRTLEDNVWMAKKINKE